MRSLYSHYASLFFSLTLSFCSTHAAPTRSASIAELCNRYAVTQPQNPDEFVRSFLQQHHLIQEKSPFTYEYGTEIYTARLGHSMPLPEGFQKISHYAHRDLKNAFYFQHVQQLKQNPNRVRDYHLKARPGIEPGALVSTTTLDGKTIEGTFFDRGSSVLMVIGSGFTNAREELTMFVDMFQEYDLLFFDFRGHGITQEKLLSPRTWKHPIKRLFGIDPRETRLGLREDLDVLAITTEMKKKKRYATTIGLGICFSATIFLKTEALYPGTFDKLILDGTWRSLGDTTQRLSRDLALLASPQRGGFQNKWFCKNPAARRTILWIAENLFGLEFNTLSALDYAPRLTDIPVLMWHSKDDKLVSRTEFESVWNSIPSRTKTAVITSNPHVWNHLKQKEDYKEICDLFVTQSHDAFTHLISNPAALAMHKTREINGVLAPHNRQR